MMKNIFFAMIFLVCSGLSAGNLSGFVTNSTTGLGINSARIQIPSLGAEYTDEFGFYEFEIIPDGEYEINVSKDGYESFSTVLVIADATEFDIALNPFTNFGTISGTVFQEESGEPLHHQIINFIPANSDSSWLTTHTNMSGSYSANLPVGEYIVSCFMRGHGGNGWHEGEWEDSLFYEYIEYFDNTTNIENATPIIVVEGETVSDIDFGLPINDDSSELTYFTQILNGYESDYLNYFQEMGVGNVDNIILQAPEGGDIGDEIGILDSFGVPAPGDCEDIEEGEILVGAGVYTGESMIIPIYENAQDCDNSTQLPGFVSGNEIQIVLWDSSENEEIVLDVEYIYTSGNSRSRENAVFGSDVTICSAILRGDLNGDLNLNVLDVIITINFVLEIETPTEEQLEIADFNGDGTIDILDVTALINEVLTRNE